MIHCAGNCKQGDAPCNCEHTHDDALDWHTRAQDLGHAVVTVVGILGLVGLTAFICAPDVLALLWGAL